MSKSRISRTKAEQAKSQCLLAGLQLAHQKLQAYATQAEGLAAARERNRLQAMTGQALSQLRSLIAALRPPK